MHWKGDRRISMNSEGDNRGIPAGTKAEGPAGIKKTPDEGRLCAFESLKLMRDIGIEPMTPSVSCLYSNQLS